MVQGALAASEIQARNQAKVRRAYDYIVIGSGASGAIIAGDLSKTGAFGHYSNASRRGQLPSPYPVAPARPTIPT